MDRKNFLKTSLALCGVGFIGAFIESCQKKSPTLAPQGPTVNFTLDLSQPANASLNTVGGSLSSNGVVIATTAIGSYVCIAESCTHNGCSIAYNKGGNNFVCPCHGGTFDTNGNVTSGPPPGPEKKYTVTKNGNILTVVG